MQQTIQALFGVDKLETKKQLAAVTAFNNLVQDQAGVDESIHARVFLGTLGVHRLDETVQKDIIKKTKIIVEALQSNTTISKDAFKWNSISESYQHHDSKIKKSEFHWGNELIAENVDKIKKSEFHWGPDTNQTTLKS